MRRIASEVQISARPEEVWAVLTDFERFHEWNPFLMQAAGRAEPGQRLSLRFRLPGSGREMVFKPTVLVSEAPGCGGAGAWASRVSSTGCTASS
ncbi:SRPBCC family protein [Streptomyces coeruleorubidus]|uniref:SRPBCC family protein n=1 Tax=Streptomyces coeruleorubidus TaxID=116188 RepID=UPI00381B4F09